MINVCRKCPKQPSSTLLTTAAEISKVSKGCFLFAYYVFSPHDMNVFMTDFITDIVATHVQDFQVEF